MLFWIVVPLVVVALVALAWWSSGRSRPDRRRHPAASFDAQTRARIQNHVHGGDRGPGPM